MKASDFACNICFDLAQDPIITLCGHLSIAGHVFTDGYVFINQRNGLSVKLLHWKKS